MTGSDEPVSETAQATFWIDGERFTFYGTELKWVYEIARQAETKDEAWEQTGRFGRRVRSTRETTADEITDE